MSATTLHESLATIMDKWDALGHYFDYEDAIDSGTLVGLTVAIDTDEVEVRGRITFAGWDGSTPFLRVRDEVAGSMVIDLDIIDPVLVEVSYRGISGIFN